jgi:hypothetical protein
LAKKKPRWNGWARNTAEAPRTGKNIMSVGDLVLDEYGEKGIISSTNTENFYVEVTFFAGLYGIITCQVHKKFLTLMSKAKKNETT